MQEPMKIQIQNANENSKTLKEIVEEFYENIEWHLKLAELSGKVKRSQYNSYISEGFTEQQALFLIK